MTVRPWGTFLLWPAGGLGIAAAGYSGLGPGNLPQEGRPSARETRFVLAPVLFGQRLSLLYYRRQCRAWDEVVPGVWIGRVLGDAEAATAVRAGVVPCWI